MRKKENREKLISNWRSNRFFYFKGAPQLLTLVNCKQEAATLTGSQSYLEPPEKQNLVLWWLLCSFPLHHLPPFSSASPLRHIPNLLFPPPPLNLSPPLLPLITHLLLLYLPPFSFLFFSTSPPTAPSFLLSSHLISCSLLLQLYLFSFSCLSTSFPTFFCCSFLLTQLLLLLPLLFLPPLLPFHSSSSTSASSSSHLQPANKLLHVSLLQMLRVTLRQETGLSGLTREKDRREEKGK